MTRLVEISKLTKSERELMAKLSRARRPDKETRKQFAQVRAEYLEAKKNGRPS